MFTKPHFLLLKWLLTVTALQRSRPGLSSLPPYWARCSSCLGPPRTHTLLRAPTRRRALAHASAPGAPCTAMEAFPLLQLLVPFLSFPSGLDCDLLEGRDCISSLQPQWLAWYTGLSGLGANAWMQWIRAYMGEGMRGWTFIRRRGECICPSLRSERSPFSLGVITFYVYLGSFSVGVQNLENACVYEEHPETQINIFLLPSLRNKPQLGKVKRV